MLDNLQECITHINHMSRQATHEKSLKNVSKSAKAKANTSAPANSFASLSIEEGDE